MFNINYFRIKDGVQVTASFETEEQAIQWAKNTGRPGASIYQEGK